MSHPSSDLGSAPSDLYAAESAAQVTAIWFVLKRLTRYLLKRCTPAERAAYLDEMLQAAETILLPTIDDEEFRSANEWVAHRYWRLIAEFVEQISEQSRQNAEDEH